MYYLASEACRLTLNCLVIRSISSSVFCYGAGPIINCLFVCLFVCLSGWIQSFHTCLYKNWSCQLFVLLSIPRWFSPSLRTRRSWIFKNTRRERNYERVQQNKKQGKGVREILPGLFSPPLFPFLFFLLSPSPHLPFLLTPGALVCSLTCSISPPGKWKTVSYAGQYSP